MGGIPGMPISLSAGGGGPSGAGAYNGISNLLDVALNFDHSGWVINRNSPGSTITATGNKDANQSTQTPSTSSSAATGGLFGGISPAMLMIGAAVFLLITRH